MESDGRREAPREAAMQGAAATRAPTEWSEFPTAHAHPRLVLTRVWHADAPSSPPPVDLVGALVAGGAALLVTAEIGRRVGAPTPVTLVCAVAAFAAVVRPRR
jgi:hypothetical protein